MSRVAYVNGRYLPHGAALVHVEDRGFQFADGIYEVFAVAGGRLVDCAQHLNRLHRSLAALFIPPPMAPGALLTVMEQLLRRNRIGDGMLYLQITRGTARRDHAFPAAARPSLVMTARALHPERNSRLAAAGVKVITLPDLRWARCDIKSIALLPNVLAKQAAREAGAYEAWLVDRDGYVTEGSSSNAWIVDHQGDLVTRAVSNAILEGVTRQAVVSLVARRGIALRERKFSVAEAQAASEAFITSSTAFVLPVVQIDQVAIGTGRPGPVVGQLARLYRDYLVFSEPMSSDPVD